MCGFFVGVAGFTMATFINTNKMVDVLSDYSEDFEEDESEVKSAAKPSLDTQTPRRTMTDAMKKTKSHRLPPKPKGTKYFFFPSYSNYKPCYQFRVFV